MLGLRHEFRYCECSGMPDADSRRSPGGHQRLLPIRLLLTAAAAPTQAGCSSCEAPAGRGSCPRSLAAGPGIGLGAPHAGLGGVARGRRPRPFRLPLRHRLRSRRRPARPARQRIHPSRGRRPVPRGDGAAGGRPDPPCATVQDVPGTYDLVMFNHSFEHVEDPLPTLRHARNLLAPGATLLLRTPVAGCWAWRHYGTDWVSIDAPRHAFIPSIAGLRAAAGRRGSPSTPPSVTRPTCSSGAASSTPGHPAVRSGIPPGRSSRLAVFAAARSARGGLSGPSQRAGGRRYRGRIPPGCRGTGRNPRPGS